MRSFETNWTVSAEVAGTMLRKAIVLWIVVFVTLVPYATWYLFVHATKDQYALLITFVLFWFFGYWSIVGPILAIIKIRAVFRVIERASSKDELMKAVTSPEAREVAIDLIATENHIPRFLAVRVYELLAKSLLARARAEQAKAAAAGTSTT